MTVVSETLLSVPDAVQRVTGEKPTYPTVFRWMQRGFDDGKGGRIRLEYAKCGVVRRTSVEAVRRFFAALSEADGAPNGAVAGGPSRRNRESQVHAAERKAAALGV